MKILNVQGAVNLNEKERANFDVVDFLKQHMIINLSNEISKNEEVLTKDIWTDSDSEKHRYTMCVMNIEECKEIFKLLSDALFMLRASMNPISNKLVGESNIIDRIENYFEKNSKGVKTECSREVPE